MAPSEQRPLAHHIDLLVLEHTNLSVLPLVSELEGAAVHTVQVANCVEVLASSLSAGPTLPVLDRRLLPRVTRRHCEGATACLQHHLTITDRSVVTTGPRAWSSGCHSLRSISCVCSEARCLVHIARLLLRADRRLHESRRNYPDCAAAIVDLSRSFEWCGRCHGASARHWRCCVGLSIHHLCRQIFESR